MKTKKGQRNKGYRLYLSHPIRGPKGNLATKETIERNCWKAIQIGREIKAYLLDWEKMDGFPSGDLYVPAEHDEALAIALQKGYLTVDQVLDIDCEIISRCDLLLVYGPLSSGMKREVQYAQKHNIPLLFFDKWDRRVSISLKYVLTRVLEERDEENSKTI